MVNDMLDLTAPRITFFFFATRHSILPSPPHSLVAWLGLLHPEAFCIDHLPPLLQSRGSLSSSGGGTINDEFSVLNYLGLFRELGPTASSAPCHLTRRRPW